MRLTTGALFSAISFTVFFTAVNCSRVEAAYEHLPDEQVMGTQEKEILEEEDAKKYMLKLINRDRASLNLTPVLMDDTATKAGKLHSDEMASQGYLSHWTMDGKKPDERYTEAGGKDAVMENAFVSLEGTAAEGGQPTVLTLKESPVFRRYELDTIESSFFNEKPPYDGHRKNILNPLHNYVGLGLSFAASFGSGVRTSCAQEFINRYGEYGDIPQAVKAGDSFTISGKLAKGVQLDIVDLRWETSPKAMTVAELNKTSSYSIPNDVTATFTPDPRQTKEPIKITPADDGTKFSLLVPVDKSWQPGLYYLSLWGLVNGGTEETIFSTRTFLVTAN